MESSGQITDTLYQIRKQNEYDDTHGGKSGVFEQWAPLKGYIPGVQFLLIVSC